MLRTTRHRTNQSDWKRSTWLSSLVFIAAITAWPAFSQHITKDAKFRRLSENIQLSNLNITTITQDSKGFLWVGTLDGLNRFDGYEFKTYRNIEHDTTSLAKNRIETLFEDSDGTLWVSTLNSGFQYYNRTSDAFCRVPEFSQRYCQVFHITEDDQHNLWDRWDF
jgi:ligand-binding sensor domain-containing protein